MPRRKILLSIFLLITLVLLTGCKISFKGKKSDNDGGVFRSVDKGDNWEQKVLIPTITGVPASIATVNVNKIIIDPQDHLAVYLASKGTGLFFSYDGGESWQIPRSQPNEMKVIEDIAVDSKNSCTIYVAATNRIFKSINCSRDWEQMYFGTRSSDIVTALEVDWYNSSIVYAGTSEGNFMQSTDYGVSWTTVHRVNNKIEKILIDPYDSRIIYIATASNGIYITADRGNDWQQIKDELKEYSNALKYKSLVFDKSKRDSLIFASEYGLLKTIDGGSNWEKIELITKEGKANIHSLAVDPENGDGIYYATESTFYKTLDGGKNWISQKLPTSRAATALVIDFEDLKVIYMGITKIGK